MQRREFLSYVAKGLGCHLVAAHLPQTPSLKASQASSLPRHLFPQGLASADPTPSSVVLWTRVEARDGSTEPVDLLLQVSPRPDFALLVVERPLRACVEQDHTLRVLVTELETDQVYYYRFLTLEGSRSRTGRTRTAPAPDSQRPVRLAWASCQSYEGGYYHAWRALLDRDKASLPKQEIDFVLHLGDFIYEALGYGQARHIPGLPSGGGRAPGFAAKGYARTLEDYRFLYRTYLSDPDLQEARARWPFIVTWDDHEFSDDCWQSASTYLGTPCPDQTRRLVSSQAWFEYIPALLSSHPGMPGVPNKAHDFQSSLVNDSPFSGSVDEAGLESERNNLAAIGALGIYRSFRWGQHVDLLVTDTRSHRSAHCVPGELNQKLSGTPRNLSPCSLVRLLDAGREANQGKAPEQIPLQGTLVPNPRCKAPPGTILGVEQKAWFKAALKQSTATWKVWANSIPLQPLRLDLQHLDPKAVEHTFTIDSWDGYPSERKELLSYIAQEGINNFVSLSGDHHAHIAGAVAEDYDAATPHWVGAEFAGASISAQSLWEGVVDFTKGNHPLLGLVLCDGRPLGLPGLQPNLNTTFLWGTRAAATLAQTGSLEKARAVQNPEQNRHLAYCDTTAYGISLAVFDAQGCQVELLTLAPPVQPEVPSGTKALRRAFFNLPSWKAGEQAPKLSLARLEGQAPFPLQQSQA